MPKKYSKEFNSQLRKWRKQSEITKICDDIRKEEKIRDNNRSVIKYFKCSVCQNQIQVENILQDRTCNNCKTKNARKALEE